MEKGDFNLKGFTIIEVSLVLAIAGLIFLMIFIALPALQRQQRDTARKEDITALISAVKKYQTNNRGALPSSDSEWDKLFSDYLGNGFEDPSSGEVYDRAVVDCNGGATGQACRSAEAVTSASFPNNFTMYIVKGAKCSGDEATGALQTSNPRKIAVLYKLEGGGLYCEDS